MLHRSLSLLAVLALLGACQTATQATNAKPQTVNNSVERKQRVLANLKAKYPQLATLNPTLKDFESTAHGMERVEMELQTPRGPQTQILLVTSDDKAAYMVLEGPIDVSRSAAEIDAELARARGEKKAALAKLIEGQPVRGPATAPVTIVEFSDYQCPYCKRGYETVEAVLAKYPDKVKVVFMPYPLPFHPWAKPASIAGRCAGNQDAKAHWTLYDNYFQNQADMTVENVVERAEVWLADSGIDLVRWKRCTTDTADTEHQAAAKFVDDTMAAGSEHGVDGTPAFFIDGELLSGAQPIEAFDQQIQAALGNQG